MKNELLLAKTVTCKWPDFTSTCRAHLWTHCVDSSDHLKNRERNAIGELWDCVFETCSHMLREILRAQAASVILSHLVDQFSFEAIKRVPSNIPEDSFPARPYVFEDNEGVIRIIIRGRSSNLKHVSRTHRVDLDWPFERINLDKSMSIRFVRTTEQSADMSTKGSTEISDAVVQMHPQTKLHADRNSSEPPQTPRATSDVYNTQRGF